jgi:hypothetical protein
MTAAWQEVYFSTAGAAKNWNFMSFSAELSLQEARGVQGRPLSLKPFSILVGPEGARKERGLFIYIVLNTGNF